mmetsp:Transcript_137887/g.326706  ORF Transcript_137887/g.326706 Transcript_137887/m.326706 type:complete len:217 (+) Transcript_137887:446-1096(+)
MHSFTSFSTLGSPSAGCGGTQERFTSIATMGSSVRYRRGNWSILTAENLLLKCWPIACRSPPPFSFLTWPQSESSSGCTKICKRPGSITPVSARSFLCAWRIVGMMPSPKHQRSITSETTMSNFSATSSPTTSLVDIIGGSKFTIPRFSVISAALAATTSRQVWRIRGTASQSQTSAPSSAAIMPSRPMPDPASNTRGRRPSFFRWACTASRIARW